MKIADVKLGSRVRTNLGDLKGLAENIEKNGLLQPIVVDPDGVLICGHRRYEACKLLGWPSIDARVVNTRAETIDALLMERDENYQRKPFAPSEAIAMKRLIEGKYRYEARRRAEAGRQCGANGTPPVDIYGGSKGDARDLIAKALGIGSHYTLKQAERVCDQGSRELVRAMDEGVIPINTAAKLTALPMSEQKTVVAGGKEAMRAAAQALPKRPRSAPATTPRASAKGPIPAAQAPQMSALVQRVKIMAALDYVIAADAHSLRVLQEIIERCQKMVEKFTAEGKSS